MEKNRLKIAFIANGFGLSNVMSGGEIRMFNIIKNRPKNIEAELFSTPAGLEAASKFFKKITFATHVVRASFITIHERFGFQRMISYIISAVSAAIELKKESYGAIYTSSDFICDVYPAYAYKKHSGTKWFCMLHHKYTNPFKRPGFFPANLALFLIQLYSFRLISKLADCVFVLDTDEGVLISDVLRRFGYNGIIEKVKNGIDLKTGKYTKDNKLAVYVGGLRPSKGLYDIIPIWEKVHAVNKELKLSVIGSGSVRDMKYLRNGIKNHGLEGSVEIMGYVNNNKLQGILQKSFMLFLPSREEGWGISVLEALMSGCHAVVYDLPAFRIFENEIIRIPRHNPDIYAGNILETFKKGRLKKINYSFLKKFTWSGIAKNEFNAIKKISAKPS
jgi:glycosyltransferase involved in cell wall biosynthesis